jgi:hypothetical protein
MTRIVQFVAIILTALCLVRAGAHVLELANKIGLDQGEYTAVQQIYRGWALLGIVLIAAILANGLAAIVTRRQRLPTVFAAAAAVLLCLGLAIFFTWTFPANQVTSNWTALPANWQTLRAEWEFSHAANAALTFLALCSATASGLLWRS